VVPDDAVGTPLLAAVPLVAFEESGLPPAVVPVELSVVPLEPPPLLLPPQATATAPIEHANAMAL
jgi:hypothetical protein